MKFVNYVPVNTIKKRFKVLNTSFVNVSLKEKVISLYEA